jgi:hypothetical protein
VDLTPTPAQIAPGSSPAAGGLGAEAELVGEAVARLRLRGDAPGTLAALAEHRRRFPLGALRNDAEVVRVEALAALGRRVEALAVLESLPEGAVVSSAELRLLRAELRAGHNCAAAVVDFDGLLAQSLEAALTERALYGRAGCRLRLGDAAGARQDLHTYLTRFPTGRFAPDVRQHLRTRR